MKIFDPNSAGVALNVQPRYTDLAAGYNVLLTNEDNREVTDISTPVVVQLNAAEFQFQFTFATVEGQRFSIKITDNTGARIIWRGKALSTAQTTQSYKING